MAASLVVRIRGETSSLTGALDKVQSKLDGIGSKATAVGRKLTVGITTPLLALGGVAFKASADLEESLSKTDVAFGEASKGVRDWAKNLNSAFGFTQRGALDAASGLGLLFTNFGFGDQEAAKLAKTLTERAADMGSLFNAPSQEVAEAIQSAFVGETEPIRRFGVILSEEKVKAEAYASGIAKMGEPLTQAQKIQARMNIIMRESAKAHGDATRTAGTAAGQMRVLKADVGRASEELGQKLLPIGKKILGFLNDLLDRFTALSPETQNFILAAAGIAAAIGPLLIAFGSVIKVVGLVAKALIFLAANPIVLIIAGVALMAFYIIKNWDKIKEVTEKVWGGIKNFFHGIWEGIKSIAASALNWIIDKINGFISVINKVISVINKLPGVNISKIGTIGHVGGAAPSGGLASLAKGGIVTKPTLAMIGEAGPEAVVPLNRYRGADTRLPSGDLVIEIDGQAIARIARAELLKTGRRNVNVGLT